jgi:hypothetical protein
MPEMITAGPAVAVPAFADLPICSVTVERHHFGPDYQDQGLLFCWEDGRPPHPDTITRRFKGLSARADLPLIDLMTSLEDR